MDEERRVLKNSCLGINGDTITHVGQFDENFRSAKIIDGSGMIVMPGLIDSHAHAGYGLLKNIGEGLPKEMLSELYTYIYYRCTTQQFWFTEAMLSGIEKLKFGVTSGVSFLGSETGSDGSVYAEAHVEGMVGVGIRDILCIGPPSPPFPKVFTRWDDMKMVGTSELSLKDSLDYTRNMVKKFNRTHSGCIYCYPSPSLIGPLPGISIDILRKIFAEIKDVSNEYGTKVHSHSYGGDVIYAYENLDVLSENTFIAGCNGLSPEEIDILSDKGVSVCLSPYSISRPGESCEAVNMMDAGINVVFSTDICSPDRSYDLLEKARMKINTERDLFHDNSLIPAGRALEMITVDAAKAVGLNNIIGSIECGKKADVICIDADKPHLYPLWLEPMKMVYQASGHDVDTVIVNGRILMENRRLTELDEKKVLATAQNEAQKMLLRGGVRKCLELPDGFWSKNHYNIVNTAIDLKNS